MTNPKTSGFRAFIVMGVSGCGKTTVGKAFAKKAGIPFYDGDDYHPESNIRKMEAGIPLQDEDRLPWLHRLVELINTKTQSQSIVLACSALKEKYRLILQSAAAPVIFVLLHGDVDIIRKRMEKRQHFMPVGLLQSQLEALEIPNEAIVIPLEMDLEEKIRRICEVAGA